MYRRRKPKAQPKAQPEPPSPEELHMSATRRAIRRMLFQDLAREAAPIAYQWHHEYPEWMPELLKERTWRD
jgi:hypothetical protein